MKTGVTERVHYCAIFNFSPFGLFYIFFYFGHDFLAAELKTSLVDSFFQFKTERCTGEARHKTAQQLRYSHSDESSVTIVTFLPLICSGKKIACNNVVNVDLIVVHS